MPAPSLSVVIPTHDRAEVLLATLEALDAQQWDRQPGDPGFEVIVVDDGSTDDTQARLAAYRPRSYRLRCHAQSAKGPAAARNLGVQQATGSRVLFLGDDTAPRPDCLARHVATGEATGGGVQGHIDWDPTRDVTELMAFLAPAGPQFYFAHLQAGERIPYTAVLGSNLSVPRTWLLDDPFDEDFPYAAFEDTELAYRWSKRRRHVVYDAEALCWHRHHYERIGPFLARQRRAGRSARVAIRRHPSMAWTTVLQPTLFAGVTALRLLRPGLGPKRRRWLRWDLRCRLAFARGWLGG